MSKLGDSLSLEGAIVPAQDHRVGLDTDVRAREVCVRILDRDAEGLWRDDPALRGGYVGLSVWEQVENRRPEPLWREVLFCVVCGPQGYTGSGLGDGTNEPGAAWTGGGGGGDALTGGGGGNGYVQPWDRKISWTPPDTPTLRGMPIQTAIHQSSLYNGYSV